MTLPLIAAEASHFCLGKSNQNRVRRNASLRCRPLPANRGKPWAAIIFRGLFFFNGPQDCCAVSPGYLIASIPCMRKLAMPWAATQSCRFSPVSFRSSSADGRRSIHTNVCILMDVIPSRTMPICCDDILKYLWVNFNRHGTMRAAICPRKTQGPLRETLR